MEIRRILTVDISFLKFEDPPSRAPRLCWGIIFVELTYKHKHPYLYGPGRFHCDCFKWSIYDFNVKPIEYNPYSLLVNKVDIRLAVLFDFLYLVFIRN